MKKSKMVPFARLGVAAALMLGTAFSAQAGLVGVKTIEVSNSIGEWLQVAEVVAINDLGVDVALTSFGATASAPDSWDAASSPSKAIDGITAGNWAAGQIFHEGNPRTGDTLTITLPSVQELVSIAIWGRTDCCSNRDIYEVVFKDLNGDTLYTASRLDARSSTHFAFALLPDTAVAAVPEPGAIALIGLGLFGIGAMRLRGRR